MKLSPIALLLSSVLLPNVALAQTDSNKDAIEVFTITTNKFIDAQSALAQASVMSPDVADWLSTVPGANINKNGPVTGIAQYRGMFGDAIAKTIDGQPITSAGPNAMDAPLSYLNPVMVESMSVYRGIAPVSAGMDTIGGAIKVDLKHAQPNQDDLAISADMATSYNNINDAFTLAGNVNIAAGDFATMVYLSTMEGDNYQDGNDNNIKSTQFDKQQVGIDSRYINQALDVGISWHKSRTDESGTPALPMDIDYIDSQRVSQYGNYQTTDWLVHWQIGYQDATHGMDNYSQRLNGNLAMYRYNTAKAKSVNYKVTISNDDWLIAVEGIDAKHDATITNPNNMMFTLSNFNDVSDKRHSVFVEYSQDSGNSTYTTGLRLKQNKSDAGNVVSSMSMMSNAVKMLQDQFNQSDRSQNELTVDFAINSEHQLTDNLEFSAALGVKERAPSYQQRYLWLPMQSTGGLADGKTYIGNSELSPETAYQVNLGLNFNDSDFAISPQVFAQRVDNYIQGVPSNNSAVIMVANMMGASTPLAFTNIDATLYGMDVNWHLKLTPSLQLTGIASYVRGERDDINDDLYRISPLNARVNMIYHSSQWLTSLSLHAYAKQDHIAVLNNETASAGYSLIDWQGEYYVTADLTAKIGVNNLFDKQYSNHLGGVNRANGSDLAVGERISGLGRNAYIALDYKF